MFCCLSSVWAQQTSLVVDNQTPGWLSSKIPFADQATVKNLKVTGYLNGTDIKFIRELTELRNVVHLDLSDANIVAGGDAYYSSYKTSDNKLGSNMFFFASSKTGIFLSLPKSVTNVDGLCELDTLVVGSVNCPMIDTNYFYKKYIKYIYIREGVDSLYGTNNLYGLKKVHLPSTLRSIGTMIFTTTSSGSEGTLDVNITDAITFIDHNAFYQTYILSDTIRLPSKLQTWYTCSFLLRDGQVIYVPKSVTKIDNSCTDHYYHDFQITQNRKLHLYVESEIPPTVKCRFTNNKYFESCVVHVPYGSAELYKESNYWKDATIIEEVPVTGISIIKSDGKIYVGDKVRLNVIINPENANNKNFKLESLDENVAIVDEQGNVIAKSYGKARIMATSEDGGFTDICEFDVYEHATDVSLSSSALKMKIGEKQTLTATIMPEGKTDGQIEWSSSDTDIAEVDAEGVVKTKAKGKATITVTTVDGRHTASCEIQVYQPVTSLNLNNETLTLKTGETQQLIASISPSDADNKNVIWSSENENVASVDKEGRVTGVKSGQVWIYAESEDDETIKAGCYVTVIQPVTGLTLDKSSISFSQIGESEQLTAIVQPEDATNKDVNWTSSDQAVAIVSNGLVVCSGFGAAVIYVTTVDGGYMATCVVNAAPASGIDDVSTGSNIQIENGHILLNGLAIGTNVTVCDTAGRVLYSTKISASGCVDIPNIGRGIFIIKIGNTMYKVVL